LFVDASGNVGVGATPSSYKLDVFGAARLNSSLDASLYLEEPSANSVRIKAGTSASFIGTTSNHPFYFVTNNTERMRLTSAGLLGLGTSSADNKLSVGIASADEGIELKATYNGARVARFAILNPGVDNTPYIGSVSGNDFGFITSGTRRMTLDAAGRLGIGTTSPQELFHVNTGASGGQVLRMSTNGTDIGYLYQNTGGVILGAYSTRFLGFETNGSERARIDSSGRLLVGTSTALGTNNSVTIKGTASSNPSIFFGRNENASGITAGEGLGFLEFGSGDGGIGAQIEAEADGTWSSVSDCPSRLVFSTTADGASSPTERFRLNSNGQLCINTTTATTGIGHRVYIEDGTTYAPMGVNNAAGGTGSSNNIVIYRAGTQVGSITTTNTATAYNTSSDYRLKENVVPLTGAVDRINQLQVHRFNFIGNPDTTVDGFIAHEAQAVVPECVTGTKDEVDADGNPVYQGIDQSKLVPLLTAALQEALAEIESLKARVTALEP
jgi:hypothetical protein